ncbi:unnamed protein product [Amoebophrya sp. A120]|nr:unnamed protein product [Amoebophrya sp. A120]|eukprot:GSA120T00012195001.1
MATMLGDYPFPKRQDTMFLDTIHPKDVPLGHVYPQKEEDFSLKTDDIFKAQPYFHTHNFRNMRKPEWDHGMRATTCYPNPLRRPRDLSLTVYDIEGARPAKTQIFKGQRHVDPLAPVYQLPSCQMQKPLSPRRFSGRHTNDISDIELTSSKIIMPDRNYVRDPNDASDIEYTCPNYKGRVILPSRTNSHPDPHNSLAIGDINGPKRKIPFRETNPVDPEYYVSQATTTSLYANWNEETGLYHPQARPRTIGVVPGSKPRKLQWSNSEPQLSLVKEDIAGANSQRWCGERPIHVYDDMTTKPPIFFHDPFDIPGAQVSSLKKGLVTSRFTNPITPAYTLLDGKKDVLPKYVPRQSADARLPATGTSAPLSATAASALPTPQGKSASFSADKENMPPMPMPGNNTNVNSQTMKMPMPPASGGTAAQQLGQFVDG